MSSHKEAPGIVNDAAADNTDVYAFVSPDKPDTVTLIANYVPLQNPAGGPNFYQFGDDVLYEIHIDNTGNAKPDVTYQFRFTTKLENPDTFLYNTGTITKIDDSTWNRKQFYTVTKIVGGVKTTLATNLACPPCNVGPASTPNYSKLAGEAIHTLKSGETVFAGQRGEGFYVDLGAIFDLGILRPFLQAFLIKMPMAKGVNATANLNIDTIAIQVPITDLVVKGADRSDISDTKNTIGVYASASRQRSLRYNTDGTKTPNGAFVQVSRQGAPLFNEVLVTIPRKDSYNAAPPADDKNFASGVTKPELAGLLPALYPGVFPNLAKYKKPRMDLAAILLTGIPAGVLKPAGAPKFQNVGDGKTLADLLRLNTAVKPTKKPNIFGILGGDLAGFPNGRRVFDDVTSIELRAIAGATIPLVDPSYKPDAAAGQLTEGLTSSDTDITANNTIKFLTSFPYLPQPHSGFDTPNNNNPANDLGAINKPPNSGSGNVPVGAPNTGIAPDSGSNTGLYLGGALAAAGAVAAAGVVTKNRLAPAGATTGRPTPGPRTSDTTMDRNTSEGDDAGE